MNSQKTVLYEQNNNIDLAFSASHKGRKNNRNKTDTSVDVDRT